MPNQVNKLTNTLSIMAVVIFGVIFMANSWVSSEMEESKSAVLTSQSVTSQGQRASGLRHSNAPDQFAMDKMNMEDNQYASIDEPRKKKRKKIIYEIPLDDVNLVQ